MDVCFELTFRTVVLPSSECMRDQQNGGYIMIETKITQSDKYVKKKGNQKIKMCEKKI